MKIHAINCCTMCPVGARLVSGDGGYLDRATLVCHCLVVETRGGLVLVDSGLGLADVASPRERLGSGFIGFASPRLDPEETAARQIEALGFSRRDVRHVLLTHLDVDHAGGACDFPDAEVHVLAEEHDAAMARRTFLERERYRTAHWAHGPRWRLHVERGEPWFGFSAVREPIAGEPDILMVPLRGHTRGHAAIAVREGAGWTLHAGDAYFHRDELEDPPRCPPALATFQKLAAIDNRARLENQARLRALVAAHAREVRVVCAHDPVEFERERARRDALRAAATAA
jgi:glyoxylase-like metal-dependent hydrolase (beta-lactamase superfamily II)